jgi:adenylate cyclase
MWMGYEMNIFEKITNNIITEGLKKEIISKNQIKKNSILDTYTKQFALESIQLEEKESFNLKRELRLYFNKISKYEENIGDHPDFIHLTNNTEKHYIVSVFVDIKGSTKLATLKGLDLEEVREIKNRILTTAISIFQVFDGHIHRLQGDAIFAFFGRKDKDKEEAIVDALTAVTILQFVFKNSISKFFEAMDYPKIDIRTGLDFGDDEDVLWSKYGVAGCNEITTTSIHTDLAAKLQHKAGANKIMIGDNIKNMLDLPNDFCDIKTYRENSEEKKDEFILNYREYKYKMWVFNWEKYISFFPQLPQNNFLPTLHQWQPYKDFLVICYYKDQDGMWKEYQRNSTALSKNYSLKFEVTFSDFGLKMLCNEIIWEVNNRGNEASENENSLVFRTKNKDNNIFECSQMTAYKGHHFMKVTLKSNGRIVGEDRFGIFIK